MAVQIASSLVKNTKAAKVLNGMLMPSKSSDSESFLQLNDVYTCLIVDKEEQSAVAVAAVLRYSRTQAYCCLSEINQQFQDKNVQVETTRKDEKDECAPTMQLESNKLTAVSDIPKYKRSEPLFMIHHRPRNRPALDQVLDACVNQALGLKALDHKKNVTVDLGIDVVLKVWRDRLGFVVIDSHEFVEMTLPTAELLSLLTNDAKLTVAKSSDTQDIVQYDRSVCRRQSRSEYLDFLSHIPGMQCLTVRDSEDTCVGISMVYKDMVLFLYGDDDSASDSLLYFICAQKIVGPKVTFTTVKSERLDKLTANVGLVSSKLIRRYHTTSPPKEVDWNRVSILNCGMHIV